MRVEIKAIGPTEAKALLAVNTNNRTLRARQVSKYADDMANLAWLETGESISIAKDGTLLNGQHRLSAIVQSGVAVQMVVVTDVDPKAMAVIDSGVSRKISDRLGLIGHSNAVALAAIARSFSAIVNNDGWEILSINDVTKLIQDHPSILWASEKSVSINPQQYRNSAVLAAFAVVHERDPDLAEIALEDYSTGANLAVGSPILALRKIVVGGQFAKNQTTRSALSRIALTALRHVQTGKSVQFLKDSVEGVRAFVEQQ